MTRMGESLVRRVSTQYVSHVPALRDFRVSKPVLLHSHGPPPISQTSVSSGRLPHRACTQHLILGHLDRDGGQIQDQQGKPLGIWGGLRDLEKCTKHLFRGSQGAVPCKSPSEPQEDPEAGKDLVSNPELICCSFCF